MESKILNSVDQIAGAAGITSSAIKSALINTPFAEAATQMRWLLGFPARWKRPELWELFLEQKRLPLVLQKLLRSDSHGVDVGAHLGSFLRLLNKFAPAGRHVAFEPSGTRSKWLRHRFPNAEVHCCAIADTQGRALFVEDFVRPGFSHISLAKENNRRTGGSCYMVQVCRLDDILLRKEKIDFIKLDIEGGELAALRGAIRTIQRWHPPIIFECGSECSMNDSNVSRQELFEFISSTLCYDIFCFTDFLFGKGPLTFTEFYKCGIYPFRAFNFVALPRSTSRV